MDKDEKEAQERLEKEIGHVFPHGITDTIFHFCAAFDGYNIPKQKLENMCKEAGISYIGYKKLLAARLLAHEFNLL